MDDDPVLRELADDLERDDPRLAARLGGRSRGRCRPVAWSLPAIALVPLTLFLSLGQVLGVVALLLVIGSPLAVCWLISQT